MSHSPSRPSGSDSTPSPQPLTDRVLARIRDASLAIDRHARATRPRSGRRHSDSQPRPADVTGTPEQVREARSLRRVFIDLGNSYREYRRRTGAEVSPEVRDAACQFRREPNVASLVAVAASLDELEALPW
jgi:hypothetical protein